MKKIAKLIYVLALIVTSVNIIPNEAQLEARDLSDFALEENNQERGIQEVKNEVTRAGDMHEHGGTFEFIDYDTVKEGDALPLSSITIDEMEPFYVEGENNAVVSPLINEPSYLGKDWYQMDIVDTNANGGIGSVYIVPPFVARTTLPFYLKVTADDLSESVGIYGDGTYNTPGTNCVEGVSDCTPGTPDSDGWFFFHNVDRSRDRFSHKARFRNSSVNISGWQTSYQQYFQDTFELVVNPSSEVFKGVQPGNYAMINCLLDDEWDISSCSDAVTPTNDYTTQGVIENVHGTGPSEMDVLGHGDFLGIYITENSNKDGKIIVKDLIFEGFVAYGVDIKFQELYTKVVQGGTLDDVVNVQKPKSYYFTSTDPDHMDTYYMKNVDLLTKDYITNSSSISLDTVGTYEVDYLHQRKDTLGEDLRVTARGAADVEVIAKAVYADAIKDVSAAPASKAEIFTEFYQSGEDTTKVATNLTESNFAITNYGGYDPANPKKGVYNITHTTTYSSGQVVTGTTKLEITNRALDSAKIEATDADVLVANAPSTEATVKSFLRARAVDANGSDLTSSIKVKSYGTYTVASPNVGSHTITFEVTGANGVTVETDAILHVTSTGPIDSIDIFGTTPVFITKGSGESINTILDTYVKVSLRETINGTVKDAYSVTSDKITVKTNGGYDNNATGTYFIVIEATGDDSKLNAEKIIEIVVGDSKPQTKTFVDIDAKDITVQKNSFYSKSASLILHANTYSVVSAIVTKGEETPVVSALKTENVISDNVQTSTVGTYNVTYNYIDSTSKSEAVESYKVSVVAATKSDATIEADDITVKVNTGPASNSEIITALRTVAIDPTSGDITNKVVVLDDGGYDRATEGKYTIVLAVEGSNGVIVTDSAYIEVYNDVTNPEKEKSADIYGTSPVVVKSSDNVSLADVVKLIDPVYIETIQGKSEVPVKLTSNDIYNTHGYNGATVGTYYLEFAHTGAKSGLQAEKIIEVQVTEDGNPDVGNSLVIDANNVTIVENSIFDPIVTPNVKATETTSTGASTDITKDVVVIYNDVDVTKPGTYTVTYQVANALGDVAVKTITVTVTAESAGDVKLEADDITVKVNAGPTTDTQIIAALRTVAIDPTSGDITGDVKVLDKGGYDKATKGKYLITLSVTGSNGVIVTDTAYIEVYDDTTNPEKEMSADIYGTSPVVVKSSDNVSLADVVKLIDPVYIEEIQGKSEAPIKLTSTNIVSKHGYDGSKVGVYYLEFAHTGAKTGLEAEKIIEVQVTEDGNPDVGNSLVIDANNVTLAVDSMFDAIITPNVKATETTSTGSTTDVTKDVVVIYNDVDTAKEGTYSVTYRVENALGDVAVKTITVTVTAASAGNVKIEADDITVKVNAGPTTDGDIIKALRTVAIDPTSGDVTSDVIVLDKGGYDKATKGKYLITLSVKGSNGVTVTDTAYIEVYDDTTNPEKEMSADIYGTSPVVVKSSDDVSLADLVKLIDPVYIEEIQGKSEAPVKLTSDEIVGKHGYDGSKIGVYYLEFAHTGAKTGLEAEKIIEVQVTEDGNPDVGNSLVIDANNVSLAVDSMFDAIITPSVKATETTSAGSTTDVTKDVVVVYNDVDTTKVGTYTVTYRVENALGDVAVKTITVTVVAKSSSNVTIEADDITVKVNAGPATDAEIISALRTVAIDPSSGDITNDVIVLDKGGYDKATKGKYLITLSVKGSNGVIVTDTAYIEVYDDTTNPEKEMNADIYGTSPVVVKSSDNVSLADVVKLIDPVYIEVLQGKSEAPVKLTSSHISNTHGYNGATIGVYYLEFAHTGAKSGLEAEKIIEVQVTEDGNPDVGNSLVIDANDVTLQINSVFNPIKTPNVKATETTSAGATTDVTNKVEVIYNDVNTTKAGTYTVTYRVENALGDVAIKTITVTVTAETAGDVKLEADDITVKVNAGPTSDTEIISALRTVAIDPTSGDITNDVIVLDKGGYDKATKGKYLITLSVVGSNGVTVTDTAYIEVYDDTTNPEKEMSADIYGTSPVVVKSSDNVSLADVVKLIDPVYIETIQGKSEAPVKLTSDDIASKHGYDGSKIGVYYLEFAHSGTKSGLEAEKIIEVQVTEDGNPDVGNSVVIDANDITIIRNSMFDPMITPNVKATETTSTGSTNDLTSDVEIIYNNVDMTTFGTYYVTYRVENALGDVAVKTITVKVVQSDVGNAQIEADDITVKVNAGPTADADIIKALRTLAIDPVDGDITDTVTIMSNGGYDNTQIGTYTITLSVQGSDNVIITDDADITVYDDTTTPEKEMSADIYGTSPVIVKASDKVSKDDVIKLIDPIYIEEIQGKSEAPVKLTSLHLIGDSGYNGATVGIYYLEFAHVGDKTKLEAEKIVEVQVTDDGNPDVGNSLVIDANDVTLQIDSVFDPMITPNVKATETIPAGTSTDVTNKVEVMYNDVDVAKAGTYTVTYRVENALGDVAVKTITVTVVAETSSDVTIEADDITVKVNAGPTSDAEIISALRTVAIDPSSGDITNEVIVLDKGGYDKATKGKYLITLSVKGSNGVTVTDTAYIEVYDDTTNPEKEMSADIYGTSPVVVKSSDNVSLADVVKLIDPVYIEVLQGKSEAPVKLTSDEIVNKHGYNGATIGVYYLEFAHTGAKSGLEAEKIIEVQVTEDGNPDVGNSLVIDANDVTILKDSMFDEMITPGVKATETTSAGTSTDVTKDVVVIYNDVDTTTAGTYTVTYQVTNALGDVAVKTITVTVTEATNGDVQLEADDITVKVNAGPTTDAEIIKALRTVAIDPSSGDITSDVIVLDKGGYDKATKGKYLITLSVTGSNGVTVTDTAYIEVYDDTTNPEKEMSADIFGTSPVVVKASDNVSLADLVKKINPVYIEVLQGKSEAPVLLTSNEIITDSGYKGNTIGTYYLEFAYTGSKSGLEAERIIEVQVTDDGEPDSGATVVIEANDVTIRVNSVFDPIITPNVKGTVSNELGYSEDVTEYIEILYNNVDVTKVGTYTVTYRYISGMLEVGVKTITVTVVDESNSDVQLEADDITVKVNAGPTSDAEIISALRTLAIDPSSGDITSDVIVLDKGGYDKATKGKYLVTLSVKGSNGVIVTDSAYIEVYDDATNPEKEMSADIYGTSPVVVKASDKVSLADVVKLIDPIYIEVLQGKSEAPVKLTSDEIVSNSGYKGDTIGVYYLEFAHTGAKSGLEAEKIIEVQVTEDGNPDVGNSLVIDANNVTLAVDSMFDPMITPNVKATETTSAGASTDVTKDVVVIYNDVDTTKAGTYTVTYQVTNALGDVAVKTITVTVTESTVGNVQLEADDITVKVNAGPTSDTEIISALRTVAIDPSSGDITSDVIVLDKGGYAKATTGKYLITLSVTGSNGVTVTDSAYIEVYDDTTNPEKEMSADIYGTSPVVVKASDKVSLADLVKLIDPIYIEVLQGKSETPVKLTSNEIVSNSGYKGDTVGVYYLEFAHTGAKSNLEAEKIIEVQVTEDGNPDVGNSLVIDANDVTLAVDSMFDEMITPSVKATETTSAGTSTDVTSNVEVIYNNVDTTKVGTYTVTYQVTNALGDVAVKTITVTVVAKSNSDVQLEADDITVKVNAGPTTDDEIIEALRTVAIDPKDGDVTNKVTIKSNGGYDRTTTGTYTITLSVTGSSGVTVTDTANIEVYDDTTNPEKEMSADIYGTSPVVVKASDKVSLVDVVKLIDPVYIEVLQGKSETPVKLTSTDIISNSGYNGETIGVYYLEFAHTGDKSGLEAEKIIEVQVTEDGNPDVGNSLVIDANDVTLQINSVFDPIKTPNVKATETIPAGTSTDVTSNVEVIYNDVDVAKAGTYTVTYQVTNALGDVAVKTITVTVTEAADGDVQLEADDITVKVNAGPTTEADIIKALRTVAIDPSSGDITSDVIVLDDGGYDKATKGKYLVTLSVVGSNGVTVTDTAYIEVYDDTTNPEKEMSADIYGTSPVVVKSSDNVSLADVVKLIDPVYIEVLQGKSEAPVKLTSNEIVTNSGYKGDTVGIYYLEFAYTGSKSGLEAEKIIEVQVTEDGNPDVGNSLVIDANDVTLQINSVFDPIKTPNVKATETTSDGTSTDVTSNVEVIYNDVDTTKAGTYTVTYQVTNALGDVAVKTITVTVTEAADGDVQLEADDITVKVNAGPTTDSDIIKALRTVAIDPTSGDITSDVIVLDDGGYDKATKGKYLVTLSVVGSNGVTVTDTAYIEVYDDTTNPEKEMSADIYGTSPVVVKSSDNVSLADVVKLIDPVYIEVLQGKSEAPVKLTSNEIVTNSGYKGDTVGVYYLEFAYTGSKSGLEAEKIIEVQVTEDGNPDVGNSLVLDANDVTLLKDSIFDEFLTPNVKATETTSTGTSTDVTKDVVVLYNDVDTTKAGTYTVTYQVANALGDVAVKTITVTVTEAADGDVQLEADDITVKVNAGPTSDAEIISALRTVAIDPTSGDITNDVIVLDDGGYDRATKGKYLVTLSVKGSNGVIVTDTAYIEVYDDTTNPEKEMSADIYGTSPVVVKASDNVSLADVVKLIDPIYIEVLQGKSEIPVKLTSNEIITNSGYKGDTIGIYYLEFAYTGSKSGLEAEKIIEVQVTEDGNPDVGNSLVITANNVVLLKGSMFDPMITPDVKAFETTIDGTVSDVKDNVEIVYNNVDVDKAGTYTVTYRVTNALGDIAVKTITVTVTESTVGNVQLEADDITVKVNAGPTTDAEIIAALRTVAMDPISGDLTAEVVIKDYGNYDRTTPGVYTITLSVKGSNGVTVTDTANIEVYDDATSPERNMTADIYATTPVVVKSSDKVSLANIIKMSEAVYIESIETGSTVQRQLRASSRRVDFAPVKLDVNHVVNNSGYNGSVEGIYYLELQYTGSNTGLQAEKIIEVQVTSDGNPINGSQLILNANDVSIFKDETFYEILTPKVKAEEKDSQGSISDITDKVEVLYNDVDSSKVGTYTVTYRVTNALGDVAVKTITVEVVNSPDVVLTADSISVKPSDAPKTDSEIINALNTKAIDSILGDITSEVVIKDKGNYDPSVPGKYNITLSVIGSNGKEVTITVVLEIEMETITETGSMNPMYFIFLILFILIAERTRRRFVDNK